jgi:hypothetical protein
LRLTGRDGALSYWSWLRLLQTKGPEVLALRAIFFCFFATGLGALGLIGWRRKKKAAALAA